MAPAQPGAFTRLDGTRHHPTTPGWVTVSDGGSRSVTTAATALRSRLAYPRHANDVFLGPWDHACMGRSQYPPGLGPAGRSLWREVNREFGLAAHESAILVQCCRCVDRLDAIEAELSGATLTVEGSTGQPRAHPLLAEWRHQARVLESLSRALSIPLPGEDVGRRRSPTAREAALQRWGRDGVA